MAAQEVATFRCRDVKSEVEKVVKERKSAMSSPVESRQGLAILA